MPHKSLARIRTKRSQAATRAYLEAQRIFKLAARADKAGMRGDARKLYNKAKRLHARAEASGLMMGPVGPLPNPRIKLQKGPRAGKFVVYFFNPILGTNERISKPYSTLKAAISHGNSSLRNARKGMRAEIREEPSFKIVWQRTVNPALDEWDVDDDDVDIDAAFKLGTQQARALGRSAREHRAGLKLYRGGYYSRLRDKHVEFVRPIEAHSAAEAKAQVKAMVTNEKPVNVTAKEVKRNPSKMSAELRQAKRDLSKYVTQSERLYARLNKAHGDNDAKAVVRLAPAYDRARDNAEKAAYWVRFYQDRDQARTNPTVGEKISQLRHEGVPQRQAVAIAFSEKRAGKVNPTTYGTSYFTSRGAAERYYAEYEPGGSKATIRAWVDGKIRQGEIHIGKPPYDPKTQRLTTLDGGKRYGIVEKNPGLVDLAANLQAAEFLTGGGRKRKRNAKREYKTVSTHTLKGLREAERLKAAGWRIVSSGLYRIQFERDRPQRRKHNPSIHKLSETFQGQANGAVSEYKGSNSAPGDLARIGKLIELHVDNAVMRLPGTMVAADKQAKLWLVSKRTPVFQTKAKRGERLNAGQITRIVYLTAKSHVEGGKLTEYDHRFDEPYPRLLIDHEGMPIVSGGKYRIRREGIVG